MLLQQSLDGNCLDQLKTLKISATSIEDEGIFITCEIAPNLMHLELNKLNLTDEAIWKALRLENLQFIEF